MKQMNTMQNLIKDVQSSDKNNKDNIDNKP